MGLPLPPDVPHGNRHVPHRGGLLTGWRVGFAALIALAPLAARAQTPGADPDSAAPFGSPVDDRRTYVHALLEELEGRFGPDAGFRWEGEGWVGGDFNRLWLKSEGQVTHGRVEDGQQALVYDRPITTYFDVQAGGRYDLDSRSARGWGALGVEGFASYYATVSTTVYASTSGHYAAKIEVSDEVRFTQRLILEPRAELNLYTRGDPARGIRSGLSDVDLGLRLRYEITRKLAPYVGATYEHRSSPSSDPTRTNGSRADELRFAVGVRSWF